VPILQQALDDLGVLPPVSQGNLPVRNPDHQEHGGAEYRRHRASPQRPKNQAKQALLLQWQAENA
jgi:hypothetical protein